MLLREVDAVVAETKVDRVSAFMIMIDFVVSTTAGYVIQRKHVGIYMGDWRGTFDGSHGGSPHPNGGERFSAYATTPI